MIEPRRGDTVYGMPSGRRRILAVNNPGGDSQPRHCFVVLDDMTMVRVSHLVQIGPRTWRGRP